MITQKYHQIYQKLNTQNITRKDMKMINSGAIGMPLHFGKMPTWLTERMGKMGAAIVESVVQNYGKSEV